ncbi:MAG: 6-carboxytetrahydropterin synthase [Bacteroidetes bacterium]|nr:6-carboxytetrahydropterin synthase [Bacteroidales bacterium]NJO68649.1 6-carboxytetrahydropterin synthase [Bacteroidota bacterium]
MYSVTIRDHIMIAHSFNNDFFGPASRLHGATYVVDVSFYSPTLNQYNVVIDIGIAQQMLHQCLEKLRYQNLDEMPEFNDKLTTTEFLAYYIHKTVKHKVVDHFQGKIKVTLGESHIAWASYEE